MIFDACKLVQQVGDTVWSMLPGARQLAPTLVTSKRSLRTRGAVNIHTFQGEAPGLDDL